MTKLNDIKNAVTDARNAARRESMELCGRRGCHRSRGTFISTVNAGGQCAPYPEAECINWKGTWREISDTIELVKAKYPDCTEIYISGGFDYAASVRDFADCSYDPWTASWDVLVWKREPATTADPPNDRWIANHFPTTVPPLR